MKILNHIFYIFLISSVLYGDSGQENNNIKKYLLDETRVVITGNSETSLIVSSDVRPSLDGMPQTLRDLVLEQLIINDANKLNISVADDEIDRYLNQLQKINSCGPDQMKKLFESIGYTYEEAREKLRRKQKVDRVLDYRVRSNKKMAVSSEEVKDYCAINKLSERVSLVMTSAFVKSDKNRNEFEKMFKAGLLKDAANWKQPITIDESDLPAEKQFVKQKKIGDIVLIEPASGGYEITKLIGKTSNAEQVLKQKKYQEVLETYENDLLSQANLQFTHDSDRELVFKKPA